MPTLLTTVIFKVIPRDSSEEFPIDMLRYDSCFPLTEDDSHMIERAVRGDSDPRAPILLARRFADSYDAKDWRPSTDRWESFGWRIETR